MKSKYIDFKNRIEYEKIDEASNAIREGELVLFPTETVYGIGANALDENAVSKIFIAKGRQSDNPLIVHISNSDMLKDLVTDIGNIEKNLMENFWPGPLTIIFNKTKNVPNNVSANLDTVGIRMPSNPIALQLIEKANVPIAAPSANISGKPSGTLIEDIIEELDGKVEYIIDAGMTDIGVESTVVRVIENKVHILRPGKITKEDIEKLGFEVVIERHILDEIKDNEKVMSPGMKYRHYAPNTKCVLVYSEKEENLINKIKELMITQKNCLVICKNENMEKYDTNNKIAMGRTIEEISRNIFTILRKVDSYNVDLVIIEGVEKNELGLAIMNRLIRACEHNYIEC
ncbi:MAG: threonylcarbamoyl-AMP synthase [Clostridia bacterium]|nr:threonylcarbamoyl-AMP synthase [Clostridia bacterium]